MQLIPITDVFFDLDHTLWDFDKNSKLAFHYLFETHKIELDLEIFLMHYDRINDLYWKLYREDKINSEDLRFQRLKDTFTAINRTVSDPMIHALSLEYLENLTQHNHLIEGALDVLKYLKPKYKLHIITNGFDYIQSKKIKGSGIEGFFHHIITSEAAGVKKPHPEIFEYAIAAAHSNPNQSVMVGDNLEADILGALDYGMEAIFYNPKNTKTETKICEINHLDLLKKHL
ncbi:MAG: noncanonical pyrimidine nucleotidase, YjjG family [Flavobacteriales bacterium CG_4_9_14_3_um_filter_40_17]|nr:MAG: noncanonical pyrimidine nucleotidase, YjjG family [Flavobacteriales bacterium CG_4_9_14_3_um_filter_40_17]